ncbi:MAG: response regulator [Chloroflexota bacterium]
MVATSPGPSVDFTQIKAIAVEDNTASAAMIGVIMTRLGMDALVDHTGKNVLTMSLKIRPDIIFCDLNLPGTSGYEVIQKLREWPQLKGTLIVACSATDPHAGIPKCKAAGFDGFIAKPLTRRKFRMQVERLMTGHDVWDSR